MTLTTSTLLREQVLQSEAIIKAAGATCYAAQRAAQRAAENVCVAAQAPAKAQLEGLKATYQDHAQELAIADNECPYNRWGSHLDPDEANVTADGILLTWDINGDYAPAAFLATWEALLALANARGAQA